jgi:TonB family protein
VKATGSAASVRALRELGLAFRETPFRVALVLSLLVHLALLLAFRWGGAGLDDGRDVPLMRVRILRPAPVAAPAPAGPVVPPAVDHRTRRRSEPPAAVAPEAPADPAPADPAPPVRISPAAAPAEAAEPAPAQAVTAPAREELRLPRESAAPVRPAAVAAASQQLEPLHEDPAPLAPAATSGAAESAAAPPGPASGAGSAPEPSAAGAARGNGSAPAGTGAPAAGPGAAGAAPGGGDPAVAAADEAASGRTGPGPRDLAAIRRRIEARKVYPQIAVRNGWEGRVLVEMRLEGDGRLAAVRLLQGSGYAVLDEATLSAVRLASPFPPVARVLTVPVEYRLVP